MVIRPTPVRFALDALDWLARDHATLERLFRSYEQLRQRCDGAYDRASQAQRLIAHLSLHLQIEEEVFYPAARAVLGADAALAHAMLDHGGTLELIDRLDRMPLDAPDFDATLAVLGSYVLPHMQEEEQAIFPLLRPAGLDTTALGTQIAQRLEVLAQDPTRSGAAPRVSLVAGGAAGDASKPHPMCAATQSAGLR